MWPRSWGRECEHVRKQSDRLLRPIDFQERKGRAAAAFWSFDPAGVGDDRFETPEEYEALIDGVVAFAEKGASTSVARHWLDRTLLSDWGIQTSEAETLRVVTEMFSAIQNQNSAN
jgi:hypothetical protein